MTTRHDIMYSQCFTFFFFWRLDGRRSFNWLLFLFWGFGVFGLVCFGLFDMVFFLDFVNTPFCQCKWLMVFPHGLSEAWIHSTAGKALVHTSTCAQRRALILMTTSWCGKSPLDLTPVYDYGGRAVEKRIGHIWLDFTFVSIDCIMVG